jgi:hypothetical protein
MSQSIVSNQLESATDAHLTVTKGDGVHEVARQWNIFNVPETFLELRELYLEEVGLSRSKTHSVEFKSGKEPAFYVHGGDILGPIVGQVSLIGNGPRTEIVFPVGENLKIEDVDLSTTRVPVTFLAGGVSRTFYWSKTDDYEHEHKAKSQVGDLELVDESGKVHAVFLNELVGSKSKGKARIGQFDVLEYGVEDHMIDQWIVTLLDLIERYVLLSSHKLGKFATAKAAAAAAFHVGS